MGTVKVTSLLVEAGSELGFRFTVAEEYNGCYARFSKLQCKGKFIFNNLLDFGLAEIYTDDKQVINDLKVV